MTRRCLPRRPVTFYSTLASLAIVGSLLLACGEQEDVGGGAGSGSGGGATPTVIVGPTTEPTAGASPTTPASPDASPIAGAISHPTGEDEIILQIDDEGGFVPPQYLLTRLPVFTLLGNGCVVTSGPQIAIYPAPMLPNLLETCLTEEGVQTILREAEKAGLLDGDAEYQMPTVADAPTTVFTVTANGRTTTVSAYALGIDVAPDPNMNAEEREARQKLATFRQRVTDLKGMLPAGAFASEERPREITRMQLVVLPADSASAPQPADATVPSEPLEWPLETTTPIAEFGEPFFMTDEEMRCGVVEGDELAPLLEQLETANQATTWMSGGEEYALYALPLVADEPGCEEPFAS